MHHHDATALLEQASRAVLGAPFRANALAHALALAHAPEADDSSDAIVLETRASEGCSVCARALVNAREMAVELTRALAPATPRDRTREAVLERARHHLAARRNTAPKGLPASKERAADPSAAVAHKHIAHPAEHERTAEIDRLRAHEQRPAEGTQRMLSQLARFLDFKIFFVSIVRGERVGYRAQRGLPDNLHVFRELRRELSYCTHCVSAGAPFIIENAFAEPFFRNGKGATRFGIGAYAGVPLRTARGIVIGTLCALDFAARAVCPETIPLLEAFARRAVAEIERERTPELHHAVLRATSPRGDVYSPSFFRDLIAAEHARPSAHGASALVTARIAGSSNASVLLNCIDEDETTGQLDESSFGILLPGAGVAAATERLERLRRMAPGHTLGFALASSSPHTSAEWVSQALRQR